MFVVPILIFTYVGWTINRKRQAMIHISIPERRLFQRLNLVATVILIGALVALGTVVVSTI